METKKFQVPDFFSPCLQILQFHMQISIYADYAENLWSLFILAWGIINGFNKKNKQAEWIMAFYQ